MRNSRKNSIKHLLKVVKQLRHVLNFITKSNNIILTTSSENLREGIEPVTICVIMAMGNSEMDEVHNIIKAECTRMNLMSTRVDESSGSYSITDDIIELITGSEFVIADLTHSRPNVYYELGYAHGIGHDGSSILLIAKEGTELHFDLSHLRVQFYQSLEHLKKIISGEMNKLVDEREK